MATVEPPTLSLQTTTSIYKVLDKSNFISQDSHQPIALKTLSLGDLTESVLQPESTIHCIELLLAICLNGHFWHSNTKKEEENSCTLNLKLMAALGLLRKH